MGRPKKKAADKRSGFVGLRLTPGDHKRLVNEARAAGITITDYLIRCWKEKAGELNGIFREG